MPASDAKLSSESSSGTPALAAKTPEVAFLDEALVVTGDIDLRKTHPNLYRTAMTFALLWLALGINFLVFTPTFLIYGLPNQLWASIFLALATCKLVCLNVYRRLSVVRGVMAFATGYMLFIAVGAGEPFLYGKGSLQLPLVYAGLTALQIPLLLEPFLNPWTARRDT